MSDEAPQSNSTASAPPHPREIAGYRITGILGSGGMATVYSALQKQPKRTVALKVLKPGICDDVTIRRFKREIEILGKLRHPNIAQVFEAGTYEDAFGERPFFVMEFVPGAKMLYDYASSRGMDLRSRIKLFVAICAAVDHGHAQRIVHRDLKPGNVLVDDRGHVKIIDFGVATAANRCVTSDTLDSEAQRLVGTIQYMAPEQLALKPQDIDQRCDVYALGVMLYKLLAGKLPYDLEGLPIFEAARIIREDEPAPPGDVKPELKGDLETIILKTLRKERGERYRSGGSIGRDLVRFLNNRPIHARQSSAAYRARLYARRNRAAFWWSVAGAAALLLVAALTTMLIIRSGDDEPTLPASASDDPSDLTEAQRALEHRREAGRTPERQPEPMSLQAQHGRITAIAFAPGGDAIISGALDHSIARWNLADRSMVFQSHDPLGGVIALGLDAAGEMLLVAAEDGFIYSFDAHAGTLSGRFEHGAQHVHDLAVRADGSEIALAADDATIRLYLLDGSARRVLRGTSGAFRCVAFSPDGRIIAGDERGHAYVWSAESGERIARFKAFEDDAVEWIAALPNGDVLTIGANGRAVRWRVQRDSAQRICSFDAAEGALVDAALSPDARMLVAASADSLRLWAIAEDQPCAQQTGETYPSRWRIHSVAIGNDGRIALGSDGAEVVVLPAWPKQR